jgi:hypothetical protein
VKKPTLNLKKKKKKWLLYLRKKKKPMKRSNFWRCMWQLRGAQQKQLPPFYYYYHPIDVVIARGCRSLMMM